MQPAETVHRAARVAIATWFGLGALYWVLSLVSLAIVAGDARLHVEAASSWLRGENPWLAGTEQFHVAAPPTFLLPFGPFGLVGGDSGTLLWMAVTVFAACWIVRRLSLPPFWLLFPPLVQGVLLGNPVVVGVAVLLGPAGALAPMLRLQLALLLITNPRRLGGAVAAIAVTAPFLPWSEYLGQLPAIVARYASETGSASAFGTWLLLPTLAALGVLVVLDWRAALWLVIPAVTPASGFYNGILALPLRHRWLAVVMAAPVAGAPAVATIVYASHRLLSRVRDGT